MSDRGFKASRRLFLAKKETGEVKKLRERRKRRGGVPQVLYPIAFFVDVAVTVATAVVTILLVVVVVAVVVVARRTVREKSILSVPWRDVADVARRKTETTVEAVLRSRETAEEAARRDEG